MTCAAHQPATSNQPPHVLFFSMHGGAAVEITELCRAARVRLDIAGQQNQIVIAATTTAEHEDLKSVGVGAPTDAEITGTLRRRGYDAVIVTTDRQVKQFKENVRLIDRQIPLIVRHGNNIFDSLKELEVTNFMSPSARALEIMQHCNVFHSRKLFNWDWLPSPCLGLDQRAGFAAYIHHYELFWPEASQRFEEVNRLIEGGPLDAKDKYSFDLPPIKSQEDWQLLLDKTWADAEHAATLIEQLPESRLWEDFADSKYGNYHRNLHGIIEHNHYHLGQIALIKGILMQTEKTAS